MPRTAAVLAIVVLLAAVPVAAQQPAPAAATIRLAIDCSGVACDQEYFRTEISFVEHVRDRQDANVHVLITAQATGPGGREITFSFFGQGPFAGRNHVIRSTLVVAASDDAERREMVRVISLGIVPYAIQSEAVDKLDIVLLASPATSVLPPDRWNRWTFRSQFGGTGTGERSTTFSNVNGSFNANRTTADRKLNIAVNGARSNSTFDLPGGERFVSSNHEFGTNMLFAESLGGHWSAGVRGSLSSRTFQNLDRSWYIAPAVEFDVFPYAESTRRLLTLQYSVGVRAFDYKAETVFGKLSEQRAAQLFTGALAVRQPWGTLGAGIDAASYLPDTRYHNVNGWGDVDLRLYRGLSLNLNVELTSVRDQLYLPRGQATAEEILVRQRQLETRYQYFYSFGITYTFGSIYSAVVNPRFARGGF